MLLCLSLVSHHACIDLSRVDSVPLSTHKLFIDTLSATAFAPVKADINGNIEVHSLYEAGLCTYQNIHV